MYEQFSDQIKRCHGCPCDSEVVKHCYSNNDYNGLTVNFYNYFESLLTSRSWTAAREQKNSQLYRCQVEDILHLTLTKRRPEPSDQKRLLNLVNLFNVNRDKFSIETQTNLLRSLFCWQTQFNDIEAIKAFISSLSSDLKFCKLFFINFFSYPLNVLLDFEFSNEQK
jgi:hypothetical protein